MEGKFLAKPQRLKVSQQIKNTHFQLGSDKSTYNTTSNHCLKPPSQVFPNPADISKQMKKTHIALGNTKNSGVSEFTKSYSKKDIKGNKHEIPKFNINEHHMVLGNKSFGFFTTHSGFYKCEKGNERVENGEDVGKNLRKHHFQLGNEEAVKVSSSVADFQPKKVQRFDGGLGFGKGNYESHFCFGQAGPVFRSTSQAEFVHKPIKLIKCKVGKDQKNNFSFGSGSMNLSSTHSQYFIQKPLPTTLIDAEKNKDLRSSHFNLGSCPMTFSQSSSQLIPQHSDFIPAPGPSISIQESHFSLGNDKSSFKISSDIKNRSSTPSLKHSKIDTQKHLCSSFSFGHAAIPESSSQHSYKPPTLKHQSASQHLIKDLKAHHFKIGSENPDFNTTSSKLGLKSGFPSKFEEGLLKDLRTSHFEIGSKGKKDFLPVQKKDFRDIRMKKEDFSGMAKEMNRTHFVSGDNKVIWKSEQKSKFNWIKPVPDNEYKPSLV